jgi:hypothetical protein
LRGELQVISDPGVQCPPGTPSDVFCAAREGSGTVRGLGSVTESYFYFIDQDPPECGGARKVLPTTARLAVEGKGQLELAIDGHPACFTGELLVLTRPFRVTGGSGAYAGAFGSGTINHRLAISGRGQDIYEGTLVVPGLEFDLTPPTFSGTLSKTVRAPKGAKTVRVRYRVTARDAVDGAVSPRCRPASGSRFKLGRTLVQCTATDASANTRGVRFAITVIRRR